MSDAIIGSFFTDVHRFQIETFPSSLSRKDFSDETTFKTRYFAEYVDLLKSRFEVEEVFLFDYMVLQYSRRLNDFDGTDKNSFVSLR